MELKFRIWCVLFSGIVCCSSLFAMTFDELQAAVDLAPAGSTVYVTSDVDVTGTLVCTKKLTIRSAPGSTNVLRYIEAGCSSTFMTAADGTDVTFADLTIDGQKSVIGKSKNVRFMAIQNGGKVTFDSGFTLKDYYCSIRSTVLVEGGGLLTMKEGAVISGLENDKWGVFAYLTGSDASRGRLLMEGGLITGCKGHAPESEAAHPDGVIYVSANAGLFTMHGGTIAGNTSDYKVAGVYVTENPSLSFVFSGASFVTNNVGVLGGDVYVEGRAGTTSAMPSIGLDGDYRGRMTVKVKNNPIVEGGQAFILSQKFTGAGGISMILDEQDKELCVDAYSVAGKAVFARPLALVGDGQVGVCGLEEALVVVPDDGLIVLRRDYKIPSKLEISATLMKSGARSFVITSDAKGPYRLTWDVSASGATDYILSLDNRDAASVLTMKIRNVVFDGENVAKSKLFRLGAYTSLVMDEGAVIENITSDLGGGAAVGIDRTTLGPACLEMLDGSIIRNCSVAEQGAAIKITSTQAGAIPFIMRGGVISNNVCRTATAEDGGAIYLGSGHTIELLGGAITDNHAENGIAGVAVLSGTMVVGGDAQVRGNDGYYDDVYMKYRTPGGGSCVMTGHFRGWIGVSGSRQQTLNNEFCVSVEDGATGGWCFHAVGRSPAVADMIGTRDDKVLKWGVATGTVGGGGIVADDEIVAAVEYGLAVETEKDRRKLPLVLTGRATALSYEIHLSFEEDELWASGELPLTLIQPGEGETLTGQATFTVPVGLKYSWKVGKIDGRYVLNANKKGLVLIFR